jgi:hypothetical protein
MVIHEHHCSSNYQGITSIEVIKAVVDNTIAVLVFKDVTVITDITDVTDITDIKEINYIVNITNLTVIKNIVDTTDITDITITTKYWYP